MSSTRKLPSAASTVSGASLRSAVEASCTSTDASPASAASVITVVSGPGPSFKASPIAPSLEDDDAAVLPLVEVLEVIELVDVYVVLEVEDALVAPSPNSLPPCRS